MSTSTARRAGPARARLTILILFAALALLAGCRTAPLTGGVDVPRVMAGTPSAPLVAPGVDRAFDWVPAKAYYERRGLPRHVWTAASSEKPGSVEAKGGDEAGGGGDLAKQAQNPIASMISLPFQDNINFPIGPHDRVQNVLNIQPVVPVKLGKWTLVNRAIVPIIYQPDIRSSNGSWTGIGDINLTTFVVPPAKGDFTWGVGPVILFPSATDAHVGKRTWGIGPSAIVVFMPGKWVLGALVNNIWSIEDTSKEGGVPVHAGGDQSVPRPGLRELQPTQSVVPDERPDRHGRLERRARQPLDRPGRRRRGEALQGREPAPQRHRAAVLQRHQAGHGGRLDHPPPARAPLPEEVACRLTGADDDGPPYGTVP